MKGAQDELKWFGEGFDGFPRILPEDTVEYSLYILDSGSDDEDVRKKLREIQNAASLLVKQHLNGFIWQRDEFQLQLQREGARHRLCGHTNFGDSIDDEWLIVYLLRELSTQFPTLWIRVIDADGQFLLVEAANALPLWLNPEIADFRVWLNGGRLLIIPVDRSGGQSRRLDLQDDHLDLEDALRSLQKSPTKLFHSSKIQDEAFYRLRKYPQQIQDSLHTSLIRVPRNLAYILHEKPAYIGPAVEAFYLRDPISMKPLQTKDNHKLTFYPRDFVTMSTKFTKVGFAQLINQTWSTPQAWSSAPTAKGSARAKQFADIGMKVACGFEMLLADPQNKDRRVVREIKMLLEDLKMGEVEAPADEEIRNWGMTEDDQEWLNIDFADFERELDGKLGPSAPRQGFGDAGAQEHLRKIVARFGDLLNEDNLASTEDSEFLDDMDSTSEASSGSDEDSEDSNDISHESGTNVDKDDFTKMMQEMMNMPDEVMEELMGKAATRESSNASSSLSKPSPQGRDSRQKQAEEFTTEMTKQEILKAMAETEAELREAGALDSEQDDHHVEDVSGLDQDSNPVEQGKGTAK